MKYIPFACLALWASAALSSAETRYVNANLVTGANDGSSWSNAFQGSEGLQAALEVAQAGDQVFVAQGMYKPSSTQDRASSFQLIPGVQILGGFAGTETSPFERPKNGAAPTVLSGDLDDNDSPSPQGNNSYHVLFGVGPDADTLLDRCVIQGGLANDPASEYVGAGLYAQYGTGLSMTDCLIQHNAVQHPTDSGMGGGAYLSFLASLNISDSVFRRNSCSGDGGGLAIEAGGTSIIERCQFWNNDAGRGGGLATTYTGGLRLAHSLFALNSSFQPGKTGAAVFANFPIESTVDHCTITHNVGTAVGDQFGIGIATESLPLEVTNSIVWGNQGGALADPLLGQIAGANWSFSLVEYGPTTNGNLATEPIFILAGLEYRLTPASPGVDAGSNQLTNAAAYSLDRGHRFVDSPATPDVGLGIGPITDMGAFEYSSLSAQYKCRAVPNSTGASGRIRAEGSDVVFLNSLLLTAESLPQNQFGFFLGSQSPFFLPLSGISDGNLCLGGSIGRFNAPNQIQNSGPTGSFAIQVNLLNIPQPTGPVQALVGQTWHFQAWVRDSIAGSPTSNLTDSVSIEFQ